MRQLIALCLLLCSPAASAVVTGRVMDEEGKPLRGVRVRARAQETGEQWYARVLSKSPEAVVLAAAQTGDDGAFRVDGKGHAVVNLALDAPGRHSVVHQVADGDDTGAIVLRAVAARRGRVTANGKGVAGATVVHNGEVVARTDASGHYEAPARQLERIIVVHPDHGVAVHHSATGEALSYDVALQPAPPIAGRVVDGSGAAVRDAVIAVDGWPLAASGEDGAFHVAHGVTDARMIVARDASRVGSLLLAEAKPPYVIRLRPAASIAGTARSTTDERPVPVARVCAHAASEALWWSCVLTDAKGGYVIDGLEPGTHRVSVSHPAYFKRPDSEVEVVEGARVNQPLLVTPYGRLAGRVTDEQRRPVAAAQVNAMPGQPTLTAPDGTFSVRTTDWQPQSLHVSKASFAPESFGPVTVGAGETRQGLEIRLTRNAQLTIRVTGRDGAPLAGEPVQVSQQVDVQSSRWLACDRGDCRTDDDGRVTFPIVEGTYDITAGGVNAVARQLTAQPLGARTPLVTIELDRGVSVSGRLVWPDDTPAVLDGHVSAATEPRVTANVEKGVFVLRNVMPGPLTLSVETGAPSYVRSEPVEIAAPAQDVKLVVPRLGRIEGRVVVRDAGEPPSELTVTVHPQGQRSSPGPEPKSFRDTDGGFVIDGIGPGRYDVVVKASGYAAGEAKVTVEEGETASASLELRPAGSVAGRVSSGGRPVPEAFVQPGLRGEWRGEMATAQADDKGQYMLEGVPPGTHELSISARGFVEASVKVVVVAGKESRADVELSRGRELRGRVIDPSGGPIASAEVNSEGMRSNARTDAGGWFTLAGVDDGKLTITATKDGYLDGRAIVEPGPPRDVTIVLGRGATVAGRVRGLSPQELTAVEVSAVSMSAPRQTGPARVDASGAFTISGVEDGEVMVVAHLKGTPPRRIQTTIRVQQAIAPPVELDFNAGIPVRGRVTARGRPVQGQVAFFAETQPQVPVAVAESAGDGSYAVQLPTPGEYRVLVLHSRSGTFNGRLTVAREMVHDVDIGGGRVSGRVVDAVTRAPVPGAIVRLTYVEARTGADGRFSLDDVPDGAQKLVANAAGYAPELHSFTAANGLASELEIALTRGTPVQVRFVDASSGQPLEGFAMIGDAVGMLAIAAGAVPADGTGLQLQLAAGKYELNAMAQGYARKSATLTVPGPPLTLALERAP